MDCWEKCSAPICPEDEQSLKKSIWYPDEKICTQRDAPDWVRTQRKVAKRAKYQDRYFTYADFKRMERVVRPRGHNPDSPG